MSLGAKAPLGHPGDLAAEQAACLFSALEEGGLRDVVVSPGSRSTPLVLAAAARPGLRLHDVLDERSAAFFALGLARGSGHTPALLCTSGSAAAHYHPALLEAASAGVPLLVISAHRPPEAWSRGAHQTIDQAALFRELCRSTQVLPLPDGHPDTLRGLAHRAARALFETRHPRPGPVHLVAPFRKPLEPGLPPDHQASSGPDPAGLTTPAPPSGAVADLSRLSKQAPTHAPPLAPRFFAASTHPDPSAIEALTARCREHRRGLIVAGPLAPLPENGREAIFALARATGFPLMAEAGSNLRLDAKRRSERIDAFPALLAGPIPETLRPELLIRLGGEPSAFRFAHLPEGPGTRTWLLCEGPAADGENRCEGVIFGPVAETCAQLTKALAEREGPGTCPTFDDGSSATRAGDGRPTPSEERHTPAPSGFARAHREADTLVRTRIAALLEAPTPALTDPQVARAVITTLPPGAHLLIGNSLPIRMIDLVAFGEEAQVTVYTRRGSSGIDGLLADAAGLSAGLRAPLTALVGDLSLAHDIGSLALIARSAAPVTLVVPNNRGGRIFELLPIGAREDLAPAMARHLVMDSAPSFAEAATHFGLDHLPVRTLDELNAALACTPGASRLIEVAVDPHGARDFFRAVADAPPPEDTGGTR